MNSLSIQMTAQMTPWDIAPVVPTKRRLTAAEAGCGDSGAEEGKEPLTVGPRLREQVDQIDGAVPLAVKIERIFNLLQVSRHQLGCDLPVARLEG